MKMKIMPKKGIQRSFSHDVDESETLLLHGKNQHHLSLSEMSFTG